MSGIRALRHIGITVSDIDAALRFYCDYLGLKPFREALGQSGRYISQLVGLDAARLDVRILQSDDGFLLELLCYASHPAASGELAIASEPGRPHLAFSVGDLTDLYERRDAFGVTFKSPPLESPDAPVLVAYCHDPDGTIVELVEPRDDA